MGILLDRTLKDVEFESEEKKFMAYWLFQGNPKYYRVLDAIRDFDQMSWLVTRYAKDIAVGDGVLIWLAGKEAGIYALPKALGFAETAEVIEPARMLSEVPDIGYWIDKSRLGSKPQARIRFTSKLLEKPLLREQLK